MPQDLRISIVHKKLTNVRGWEGRSACSLCKTMINKSRVMAGVREGGYVAKNWGKWDSNRCSHYKSVQILIITVYHKAWRWKRLFISCFPLPNCQQLPYPSALGAQPLQPLLPLSDFTMDCLLPGIPFCLHPTTCTPAWLHNQVLHIFPTRASSGLGPPDPPRLPSDFECIHYRVHCSLVAGSSAAL